MLQQTQTARVAIFYPRFIAAFPRVFMLASAPIRAVMREWLGLGYNRRALYLKRAAKIIAQRHHGEIPRAQEDLESLPGIGRYTAAAVRAFAFNEPTICIETNIRAVFLHEFFADQSKVPDRELLPLIERTLDRANPREWYYALMDYGAHLKRTVSNPTRRSAQHTKQSPFAGSVRALRGRILRELADGRQPERNDPRLDRVLGALVREGIIRCRRGRYYL